MPNLADDIGLPFLIEDVTPRSLRVPHEPEQVTHRNGVTGIAGVTVLASDFVPATGAVPSTDWSASSLTPTVLRCLRRAERRARSSTF